MSRPETCNVLSEKNMVLKDISENEHKWWEIFRKELKLRRFTEVRSGENDAVYDYSLKNRIKIKYNSNGDDIWLYYNPSVHPSRRLIILFSILTYIFSILAVIFFLISLQQGSNYYGGTSSSYSFFPIIIIMIVFYSILIPIISFAASQGRKRFYYWSIPKDAKVIREIRMAARGAEKKCIDRGF